VANGGRLETANKSVKLHRPSPSKYLHGRPPVLGYRIDHGFDHCALGVADPRRQALPLASVEINIDGVLIKIHGIRATRTATGATKVELPTFRDTTGQPRAAIDLPEEIYRPIGGAVLDALLEQGIAKQRFVALPLEPQGRSA
jgi:hypothetical protein